MAMFDELLTEASNKFSEEEKRELLGTSEPSELDLFKLVAGATRAQAKLPPEEVPRVLYLGGIPIFGDEAARNKELKFQEREKAVEAAYSKLKMQELVTNLASELENVQQRKLLGDDINQDNKLSLGEVTPMTRSILGELGFEPDMKDVITGWTHNKERLGPTQSPFSNETVIGADGGGPEIAVPDSLNTTVGMSDIGRKTMEGPAGEQLYNALVGGDMQGVERAMRLGDPGLQQNILEQTDPITQAIEDPDTVISEAMLRQAGTRMQTDLNTQKAPASPQMSVADARSMITTTVLAGGGTQDQADALASTIERPLPVSSVHKLLDQVGQGTRSQGDEKFLIAQQTEHNSRQRSLMEMNTNIQKDLLDQSKPVSPGNAALTKQLSSAFSKQIDRGEVAGRFRKDRDRAVDSINGNLLLQEQSDDPVLSSAAKAVRSALNGTTPFTQDTVKKSAITALGTQSTDGLKKGERLTQFFTDMVKSSPTAIEGFVDILNRVQPGTLDPSSETAIRSALSNHMKDISHANIVQEELDAIVNKKIYGDDHKEQMGALYSSIRSLSTMGIDASILSQQLNYMESIKSGQTINIGPQTDTAREDVAFLRDQLRRIDQMAMIYSPEYTGWWDDLQAKGLNMLDALGEREASFRSLVEGIKSDLVSDKAGAAIGPVEAELLLGYIVALDNSDTSFVANAVNLQEQMRFILQQKYGFYGVTLEKRADELEKLNMGPAQIETILVREGFLKKRSERMRGDK